MAALETLQVALVVRSRVLASGNVPTAENCCVVPTISVELEGDTAMEVGISTVNVVEPPTEPAVAASVVVPWPITLTIPELPTALLIVATEGLDELQTTDCIVWLLPSLKAPVATSCCSCPGRRKRFEGVTAIDTKPGGVRLAG